MTLGCYFLRLVFSFSRLAFCTCTMYFLCIVLLLIFYKQTHLSMRRLLVILFCLSVGTSKRQILFESMLLHYFFRSCRFVNFFKEKLVLGCWSASLHPRLLSHIPLLESEQNLFFFFVFLFRLSESLSLTPNVLNYFLSLLRFFVGNTPVLLYLNQIASITLFRRSLPAFYWVYLTKLYV